MIGFVDPRDAEQVEEVLRAALAKLGALGTLTQLASVPGLRVQLPESGRLLRGARPGLVGYADQALLVAAGGSAELQHVVGGVVLARDAVPPTKLPGVLAALLARSLDGSGAQDDVSVLLTSLRDALGAADGRR